MFTKRERDKQIDQVITYSVKSFGETKVEREENISSVNVYR